MRERAMKDIEAAKRAAMAEIYTSRRTSRPHVASKILRRELNAGDQSALVEESLRELHLRRVTDLLSLSVFGDLALWQFGDLDPPCPSRTPSPAPSPPSTPAASFELAMAQGGARQGRGRARELQDVLELARGSNPKFNEFLASRVIATNDRAASLEKIFEGRGRPTSRSTSSCVLNEQGASRQHHPAMVERSTARAGEVRPRRGRCLHR
jgi:hypothetical protein